MKTLSFLCGIALTLAASPLLAQDVVIDDFETYSDDMSLRGTWAISGNANESVIMGWDGGSTGFGYMTMLDEAWGISVRASNITTPAAGNYRMSFEYRNGGMLGYAPMKNLAVKLLQDGTEKASVPLPADVQDVWTTVETPIMALSASPITIEIVASNGGNPPGGASGQVNYASAYDSFRLTEIVDTPLEVSVFPDERVYLSRTVTLTATPSFGSGTYTQVEFDVEDDGVVDFVATSAPFEYTWDTLEHVAQGTSRTADTGNSPIPVKITVTDSASNTESIVENYTVDNRYDGRESLVENGDFSQWNDPIPGHEPDAPQMTIPVGWEENWTTSTKPEIGPAPGRNAAAGDALRIKFVVPTDGSLNGFPDRYTLRSIGKEGLYRDLQTSYWGRGPYARLYYFVSTDGGVTYRNTSQQASAADGNVWTFALESTPRNNLGLSQTTHVSLATHQLTVNEHLWDDVVSMGIKIPEDSSSVDGWKLY